MEQWEYMSFTFASPATSGLLPRDFAKNQERLVAVLNMWGQKGWELVQFADAPWRPRGSYFLIFKRRKS